MARLRHIAIATKDPEKTAAFYQKCFGLKFVKRVPDTPRGGGVFLTDGHISFAFLNFPTDEAADMEGGATYEGLHHVGFHVDDIEETNKRLNECDAERLGQSEGSGFQFSFELKYRGPNGVIFDVASKGWNVTPAEDGNRETKTA